uniref:Uncharacterized protein n=1 Tax=Parascaris equorum TaxID=6256 RepID=A0A914RAA5_PAREQ
MLEVEDMLLRLGRGLPFLKLQNIIVPEFIPIVDFVAKKVSFFNLFLLLKFPFMALRRSLVE